MKFLNIQGQIFNIEKISIVRKETYEESNGERMPFLVIFLEKRKHKLFFNSLAEFEAAYGALLAALDPVSV